VAWRISDDELSVLSREEAIRDVNRYSLLALGGQTIDEKSEVELTTLSAHLLGVDLEGCKMIFENEFRVVKQSPDQGALSIIDASARDESEH
jgi:hypothetical protein